MDSPKRAPRVPPALEGDALGASREAYAFLEDGAPSGELAFDGEVANEALPIEEAGIPQPRASQHSLKLSRAQRTRPPEKLILSSYVKSLEWSRPPMDVPVTN